MKAADRREERVGENLLADAHRARAESWGLMETMKREGDFGGAVAAVRTALECISVQDEVVSRAIKVQAVTDPPAIQITVIDISAPEPAAPGTPRSLSP